MSGPGGRPRFVVVGIGADGWDGLSGAARRELRTATTIYGSARQLALLETGNHGALDATTTPWRSPMSEHLREVLADSDPGPVHLLASGDPMFHGLGTTVVNAVGVEHVRVIPHPSSASIAAARLGWDLTTVRVVSLVTGEVDAVLGEAGDGRRLVVLSRDAESPAAIARTLTEAGWGESSLTVLEQLGGPGERIVAGSADTWDLPPVDALNLVAVECVGPTRVLTPGLPDAAFDHDGQITKQPVRALTIAALAPVDGQLLWDIGAGSGSVGIEWLRANPTGRVIAVERDAARAARIAANARRHGVSARLTVVESDAANTVATLDSPDTVFVGGGLTAELFVPLWDALPAGGMFVANAVSIPTQQLLIELAATHGGTLRRLSVEEVAPLGSVTAWRPSLPLVLWSVRKERSS